MQSPYIRDRTADVLLGQGKVIGRQSSPVQTIAEGADPALMEGMEQPRVDPRPVVNRHDGCLRPRGIAAIIAVMRSQTAGSGVGLYSCRSDEFFLVPDALRPWRTAVWTIALRRRRRVTLGQRILLAVK